MKTRDVNNLLPRLQCWYAAQCNGDWEHEFGVNITTLDNPGWLVKINLAGTPLDGKTFDPIREPIGDRFQKSEDWLDCRVEEGLWRGAGDKTKLARILEEFLSWAEATAP